MRRVRGQRTTDSFKRLLLCIFSRTGRSFGRICEVLPNEYTPQWIGARIGLHGHGSLLGDDVWYAVYWDYSDLPSDTWKQTARSLWLAMLSERGETPTTADRIKFDVYDGGTVEFGDGTRFFWSRIRTWHAASEN